MKKNFLNTVNLNNISKILVFLTLILVFNTLFNFNLWKFFINSENIEVFNGDGIATQFVLEYSYQNLRGEFFKPSGYIKNILYPFGKQFNKGGLFFIYQLFRPLFNSNQALVISLISIQITSSVLMFIFLKNLKVNDLVAIIIALSFTYTPFIAKAIQGHFEFLAIFVFPLCYLFVIKYLKAKKINYQFLYSFLISFSLIVGFLMNYYYFIELILSLAIVFTWNLITATKKTIEVFKDRYLSIIVLCFSFLLFMYPLIFGDFNSLMTEARKNVSLGSSIHYAAGLENFFIPSNDNLIYVKIFALLKQINPFIAQKIAKVYPVRAGFAYPGIIVLLVLFSFFKSKNSLSLKLKKRLFLPIITGLSFATLVLGPFLKFFNIYSLNLDGIAVLFPLPFLILHFIPGLESMRSPERFTPAFVFFILTAGAILINFYYGKFSKNKKFFLLTILLTIFIIDQNYRVPILSSRPRPTTSYEIIASDREPVTVMEIPFTLRDGIEYLGFVHAINPIRGVLQYHKSILGGYFARVNSEIFEYYRGLKFINYILTTIDKGNYNPEYQQPLNPIIKPYLFDISATRDELNFLSVKYFILKKDELYSSQISKILSQIGARLILDDNLYQLYEREIDWDKKFSTVNFTSLVDSFFIGGGLEARDGYFVNKNKQIIIFLKSKINQHRQLRISAAGVTSGLAKIFVDGEDVGNFSFDQTKNSYLFELKDSLESNGLTRIQIQIIYPKESRYNLKLYKVSIKN